MTHSPMVTVNGYSRLGLCPTAKPDTDIHVSGDITERPSHQNDDERIYTSMAHSPMGTVTEYAHVGLYVTMQNFIRRYTYAGT